MLQARLGEISARDERTVYEEVRVRVREGAPESLRMPNQNHAMNLERLQAIVRCLVMFPFVW